MMFFKPYWFVYDLCGILCMIFAEFLLLYATLVLNFLFIIRLFKSDRIFSFIFNLLFCNYLYFISSFCHLSCITTDPGVMPNGNDKGEILLPIELQTQKSSIRSCSKCNNFKPPRTHHCSVCKRCIFKMDHHCPWINNCVGINNQKQFLLFLVYVFIFCIYSLTIICYNFYKCISYPEPYSRDIYLNNILESEAELLPNFQYERNESLSNCEITPSMLIFGFTVIVESLIFGIFCIAMLVDQIICIINNTTGIEHLKQEYICTKRKGLYSLFIQVCGSRFSWKWFFPTKTRPSFITDNFDLSLFIDIEFSDFNLDVEYGANHFIQTKQNFYNENMSMIDSDVELNSGNTHCCKMLKHINPNNAVAPNMTEDLPIFEMEENCVEHINSSRMIKKSEIRMNSL